jgi:Flp pilus assembly protein TadD
MPQDSARLLEEADALLDAGRASDAARVMRAAVLANDAAAELHYKLGVALQLCGDPAAAESYRAAIARNPQHARAHNNLGSLLHGSGALDQAIDNYAKALTLEPNLADAARNLGIAWLERGDALFGLGRLEDAAAAYRQAAERGPGSEYAATAWLNLGTVLGLAGDPEAAEYSRRAVELRPDSAEMHYYHALQLIRVGEYAEAWPEYEWRRRMPGHGPDARLAELPQWDGRELGGATIVLYAEQGLGDAIQFARFAPLVAARGGRVLLYCSHKIARLLARTPGIAEVVDDSQPVPRASAYCSLLSLGGFFANSPESIPAAPYAFADPAATAHWRQRLSTGASLHVGLCWATDSPSPTAESRSVPFEALTPLAGVRGAVFYSLQRGRAAAQAATPPAGMHIVDVSLELRDFADDAALISALDIVVTNDTATGHLAGALGKPVCSLLPFPPDWRWMTGRDDSPWYPTLRLFRQGRDRRWLPVVERVAEALRAKVGR